MKLSIFFILFCALTACSSHPVLPTKKDITVSREMPKGKCQDLGMIEGRTKSVNGTTEDALEDMKADAIRKGANYVKMETMGALGTSVRGQAYFCE
ncbi:MAG: hypothetical protein BroJett040_01550 [Oligoflexia bacterium]|nr:MAG: hypothetical protein BroJett040_01550 [Oligoflexia bacterium]